MLPRGRAKNFQAKVSLSLFHVIRRIYNGGRKSSSHVEGVAQRARAK
jgi:hypothetical protein